MTNCLYSERKHLRLALGLLAMQCVACSNPPAKNESSAAAQAVMEEATQAAQAALGGDAEVLVFGALGGAGTQQVVAINRLRSAASAVETGAPAAGSNVTETDATRVSVLNKENGAWSEVLRGDEYLKNSQGYLRGAPVVPASGWRVEIEPQTDRGRVLRFTPLAPPAAVKYGAVAVAWNPKAKRYQTMDRKSGQFLGEMSALEMPNAKIR